MLTTDCWRPFHSNGPWRTYSQCERRKAEDAVACNNCTRTPTSRRRVDHKVVGGGVQSRLSRLRVNLRCDQRPCSLRPTDLKSVDALRRASKVSPLLQQYLEHPSNTAGRKSEGMGRGRPGTRTPEEEAGLLVELTACEAKRALRDVLRLAGEEEAANDLHDRLLADLAGRSLPAPVYGEGA